MFKELRQRMGVDVAKGDKPKRKKKVRNQPLTPEQRMDKRQRERMKDKAARLSILPLGNNQFKVWGGEQPHLVVVTFDGLITCDCRGWKYARHGNCSHVMKYRLTYGDLKK